MRSREKSTVSCTKKERSMYQKMISLKQKSLGYIIIYQ